MLIRTNLTNNSGKWKTQPKQPYVRICNVTYRESENRRQCILLNEYQIARLWNIKRKKEKKKQIRSRDQRDTWRGMSVLLEHFINAPMAYEIVFEILPIRLSIYRKYNKHNWAIHPHLDLKKKKLVAAAAATKTTATTTTTTTTQRPLFLTSYCFDVLYIAYVFAYTSHICMADACFDYKQ